MHALQSTTTEHAGVLRSEGGLAAAATQLDALLEKGCSDPGTEGWQATNLLTLGSALVQAARMRTETRGSHWREDHPDTDDDRWAGHLDVRLQEGELVVRFRPGGPAYPTTTPTEEGL
jgi:L-aspartate oxidase